ncbi:DUF2442 domain-containing protein [Ancylothrix sp. C2]|uniref:DUF2442 domain-containing protein n=1 Tax=Ancylothrix sp. D3o TaxID=2953691 RepID=UPI0021BBA5AB|nr:DUF2442 domain-containing protein [Ancylothrix sp. D3o]MCT7953062.1 DUF2442 domain-containing protein [Ancylothrix sp. D3o]
MKPPRIVWAEAIDNQTLVIKFTNDEFRQYDISKLLHNHLFAKLHNPVVFKNFRIEDGGYGLVWDEDVDRREYELWQNGISVAGGDVAIHLEHTHL